MKDNLSEYPEHTKNKEGGDKITYETQLLIKLHQENARKGYTKDKI
jgi:hypothetical protein